MRFKIGYGVMFIGLLIFGLFIWQAFTLDYGINEVKCYDRWSNEIIGEKCIEEVKVEEGITLLTLGLFVSVMLFGVGVMLNEMDNSFYRGRL